LSIASKRPSFSFSSALGVLKDLVAAQKNLIEPVFYAVKRFELSFYRNQLIHLFVHEAIVAVTMYTRIKMGGLKSTQKISYDELLQEVAFLSRLLKTEFIYNPGDIETNLQQTLSYLKVKILYLYLPIYNFFFFYSFYSQMCMCIIIILL
jgi:glycerol-3-phosphate O-acyltransferase